MSDKQNSICNTKNHISQEDAEKIKQVKATMAIENMNLTEEAISYLEKIASGENTVDEIIEQIKEKYKSITAGSSK